MNAAAENRRVPSHDEIALLVQIRDRAVALAQALGHKQYGEDAGGFFLDLLNVHELVGLQLHELLAADDGQFVHDVFGIWRHFNRRTRQLDAGFCPRFAITAKRAGAADGGERGE